MAKNKTRTAKMDSQSIDTLPNDKPALYKLLDSTGKNVYTGTAGRGSVRDRLKDHLPGGKDPVPGAAKVRIEQKDSIEQAQHTESIIISRSKPRYNKQGK